MLYIPYMKVNFLLVSSLEVDGFGVSFYCGQVFLYPEGDTPYLVFLVPCMRSCTGCCSHDLCWGLVNFWIHIML
jgi:hypothetical protein